MDKIIVYLDDAEFALQQLAPMNNANPVHWLLVACPPRMSRHMSKWVSHSARENWRTKWSDKLFAQVVPSLQSQGGRVSCQIANGSLVDLTRELLAREGAARVLDARRPKFGQDMQPVTPDQPVQSQSRWSVPGAVAGLGAALVLAAE